jgi:pimeloyl-ACP methyl ester carboxylesterase
MESFHEVGGHRVRVLEQGHGAPLFFLYDGWHASEGAEPLFGLLEDTCRMVAVDPPAYGGSQRPEDYKLTLKDYAKFLVKAVDLAGTTGVTLVLCDLGLPLALVAMAEEESFLAKLARVVILNGPLYPDQFSSFRPLKPSALFSRWDLPMTRMVHRRRVLELHGEPLGIDEALTERAWTAFRQGNHGAQFRLTKELSDADHDLGAGRKVLAGSGLPVLVLWGEADPSDDGRHIAKILEDLPDAESYLLPQVGHFPHLEAREVVAETIRSFVTQPGDHGPSGLAQDGSS